MHDGHDSEFDTLLLNEDKVIDWLEPQIGDGLIVEAHSTEYFPLRYFDLVVCLTSSKIYERLAAREYSALKITENIECEIFGICQEQAREFPNCLVLSSDNVDELAHNIKVIKARYLENAISSRII